MHITGECHCGGVTFGAEVDESKVLICHCTDCQIMAASAFRFGALVRRETFHLKGTIKEYCKAGSSGARRIQVFCPTCATGIYSYTPDDDGPYISLRLGGVHQRAALTPLLQIWGQSMLPWVDQLSAIPRCAKQDVIAAQLPQQS